MEMDARPPLSPQMMEVDVVPSSFEHHCGTLPPPRRQPKKSVRFADEALLYRSACSLDEVQRMWYSKEELAEFKNERRQVIRLMKKVNFDLNQINQEAICLRGYEPYFSMSMNKTTKYARQLVISIVLLEQRRQIMNGVYDPESLRNTCSKSSQWARDIALELGNSDALLNPLRLEFLQQLNQPCNFVNQAQVRISSVDEVTLGQVESTLSMVQSMLRAC